MEINIQGLEIEACHGVLEEEKVIPQKFVFDIKITTDFFSASEHDGIIATVNYAEVCALIEKIVKEKCYNLIESLAYRCTYEMFDAFEQIKEIELTCSKPQAPVPQKFKNISVTVKLERVKAYLSLGSSLGDREWNIIRAVELLDETQGIDVEEMSECIETEPYGGVAVNKFLNCAVCINTYLTPHGLLDEIHRIETACGRIRNQRWGDRTLDIDIIFYGDKTISDETLTIPHPDYKNRDFVIIPLKSIAPHKF